MRPEKAHVAALGVLCLVVLLYSGVTFGWASLLILLREEGVYEGKCRNEDADADRSNSDGYVCDAQAVRFSLTYTLAQFCHVFFGLPVGFLLDWLPRVLGSRNAAVIAVIASGSLMVAVGFLLLAGFGSDGGSGSNGVLPAMILIGCGGPTIFFPCLRCAEAFKHIPWIGEAHFISLMNALFDASAVIFALLLLIYRSLGSDTEDRRGVFLTIACVALSFGLVAVPFVGFSLSFDGGQSSPGSNVDVVEGDTRLAKIRTTEMMGSNIPKGRLDAIENPQMPPSRPADTMMFEGDAPKATEIEASKLRDVLLSLPFWGLAVFGAVHVLRSNMYLGSVGDALAGIDKGWNGEKGGSVTDDGGNAGGGTGYEEGDDGEGDDSTARRADKYVRLLSFMLPFGIAATPIVGRTIDYMGPWASLVVTNWVGVVQGLLSIFLPIEAMPLAFAVYVFYRAILYGTFCAAVAAIYGYERLGRLLGLLFTIAAIASLTQYPLVWWTVRENGGSYRYAYLILTLAQLPLFLFLADGCGDQGHVDTPLWARARREGFITRKVRGIFCPWWKGNSGVVSWATEPHL